MDTIDMAAILEDTTPTGADTNTALEDTTADGEGTTPNTEAIESDDAPTAESDDVIDETTDDGSTDADTGGADEPMLLIRFNHEDRHLTMQEAATLSQKGLAYEDTVSAVRRLAASRGQTVKEFLSKLSEAQEAADLDRLKRDCGGNEEAARRLLSAEKEKVAGAVQKMLDDEKAESEADIQAERERIAAQFEELQDMFPDEIKAVKDIPKKVIQIASEKKISLTDAYLRFKHQNATRAAQNAAQAKKAATASAGTMKTETDNGAESSISAMMRGIWGH